MFTSIFTDELAMELEQALPILKSWGLNRCDLRTRVQQKYFENLTELELVKVKQLLDREGFRLGCLESSFGKIHLPDEAAIAAEAAKLERIITAAQILDCRLVRAFFFWQPPRPEIGTLPQHPEVQAQLLQAFRPLAERARQAGLILAFENCGCTVDECLLFLKALAVPEWGLAWDVKNTWELDLEERERDFDAFLQRRLERARCLHVKAAGSAHGDTRLPYKSILSAAQKIGFQGPVSIETHNPDRTVTALDMSQRVLEVVKQAWPDNVAVKPVKKSSPLSALSGITSRPWSDNPVRFAVVGLGMGHSRSQLIQKTPGLQLLKICDLLVERAQRTAEATKVPWTTDFQEILDDPEVEAVMIMNETGRHGELAEQALAAGKHALVTKPMDISTAACDRMIKLAQQNNLQLAVDHSYRLRQHIMELRQAIAEGWFGRLFNVAASLRVHRNMDYFRASGGWRGTRLLDGGVLSNQSVHHIDELLFCLGTPTMVRADTWTQNHDIEMEDLGAAVWKYDNGLIVNFLGTTCFPQSSWYHQLELHGDQGAFIHREGGAMNEPENIWFKEGAWQPTAPVQVTAQWLNAMDNFAAAIRVGASLLCPPEDGRAAVAVVEATYVSACDQGGQWVKVK